MNRPVRGALYLIALATLLPLRSEAQAGAGGGNAPAMSPTDRARAQARLQAQAVDVFNVPIDTARGMLRAAMVPLRDTLQTVDGNAERILRADAMRSTAVVFSGARVLARQCAGSDSVAASTFARIAGMNTNDANGDRLIGNYRTAITGLRAALAACRQRIPEALAPKTPDAAEILAQVHAVDRAVRDHDAAMQALADGLDIFLLPKGYVPPGH